MRREKYVDSLKLVDMAHECDRRTDRQTNRTVCSNAALTTFDAL